MSELTSDNLPAVMARICTLTPDSPDDDFAATKGLLDVVKERVRELDAMWKSAALERCESRGDLTIGPKRYYAGEKTETWTDDRRGVLRALLTLSIEDMELCLSSDAWLVSQCRKALPAEDFARLFKSEKKTVLRDGKPTAKQLVEVDERFTSR